MDGRIYLDDDFNCGLPGRPGTRFVVELKKPPRGLEDLLHNASTADVASRSNCSTEYPRELPTKLSVLFVDDDPILRKLFSRTVKTVAPEWSIREASNGETALQLVEQNHFDLIFMDM